MQLKLNMHSAKCLERAGPTYVLPCHSATQKAPFFRCKILRYRIVECRASVANAQENYALYQRREFLVLSAAAALLSQTSTSPSWGAAAGRDLSQKALEAVLAAFKKEIPKSKAPVIVRLVFHDAGTYSSTGGNGGVNASIRFELDRPENTGLKRGWRVVEQVRAALANTPAAAEVSSADIIALAGAYAVQVCGGPVIRLKVGRTDAAAADPPGRMPAETFSAAQLKQTFADKGFSVRELVALSGAHTLGSKGYGDPVTFDNTYYKSLLQKPWLNKDDPMADMIGLPSDHVLPDDEECRPIIEEFARDQEAFFQEFARSYQKMTSLGVQWA